MRGLFVIAVLLVGGLALRGLRAGAADVTVRRAAGVVLPIPAGTDLILVSPIRSLDVGALRTRLVSAGFDALPARIDDTAVTVRVPGGTDGGALAARIEATGLARGVEPNAAVHADRVPNDPLYERQARYMDVIHASAAWDVTTGGAGVTIAVVDSGVSYNHLDMRERIATNAREQPFSGRDDDNNGCTADYAGCNYVSLGTADPSCGYTLPPPNGFASDDDGHGTFVAGLAAAAGNNGIGIAGVAWQARILPVKVLDCTATGRISDAAAGIRYAARMGADVINVSFGGSNDSLVLREAVEEAQLRGALVVASAGNDGRRGLTYPAAYPGVISVAASGLVGPTGVDYGTLASFTNFGTVDVMAPGVNVLSTVPGELCGTHGWICTDGPYASASGSSFATPLVSGAAALMRARYPDVSAQLLRILLLNSRQPGAQPSDPGLLDVGAALSAPLYRIGAPGTARPSGGAPIGPLSP